MRTKLKSDLTLATPKDQELHMSDFELIFYAAAYYPSNNDIYAIGSDSTSNRVYLIKADWAASTAVF